MNKLIVFSIILMLYATANCKTVVVGNGDHIGDALDRECNYDSPLQEDLYIMVELGDQGSYSLYDYMSYRDCFGGFNVYISGYKKIPKTSIYVGSHTMYELNGLVLDETQEFISTDQVDGKIESNNFEVYVKDHLGSTRMTYLLGTLEPGSAYHFHSYGKIKDLLVSQRKTIHKFTGKEYDNDGATGSSSGMDLMYFGERYFGETSSKMILPLNNK